LGIRFQQLCEEDAPFWISAKGGALFRAEFPADGMLGFVVVVTAKFGLQEKSPRRQHRCSRPGELKFRIFFI